jgi:hypothetical protein
MGDVPPGAWPCAMCPKPRPHYQLTAALATRRRAKSCGTRAAGLRVRANSGRFELGARCAVGARPGGVARRRRAVCAGGEARIAQTTGNASVVRVSEPPSVAASVIVRRFPRALAGTRKKQRATGLRQTSRMFRNRLAPIQTLHRIDPGAGANSTRATSSKGCAAWGGRGVTESTSIRTSRGAPSADDASAVAAANATAASAASQLIMRFRLPRCSSGCQARALEPDGLALAGSLEPRSPLRPWLV